MLGDVSLNRDTASVIRYLNALNGVIIVIPGSHDEWINDDLYRYNTDVTIASPLGSLEIPNSYSKYPTVYSMCHYAQKVWDRSHYGSFHLYAHSHGGLPIYKNAVDVGVDCWDYYPVSLEDATDRILKQNEYLKTGKLFNSFANYLKEKYV